MTNNETVARFYHYDHTRDDEFAKKFVRFKMLVMCWMVWM